MDSLIYDFYGYNVKLNENNSFDYLDYRFVMIFINETEESMKKLNDLSYMLSQVFNNDVVYIVKNKYNKYITDYKEKTSLCLLSYKIEVNIDINTFVNLHTCFLNYFNYRVKLEDIITLWDQRVEYILNQCLVNLNFENETDYLLYQYAILSVGMAYNALQYLKDMQLDFNRNNYNCTLTHRRIHKIDKLEFYNPLNLIIDHSSRDLVELYKNDLIDYKTMMNIAIYYNYEIDEYEYILARLLFPTSIFDIIEDIASDNTLLHDNNKIKNAIKIFKIQINKLNEYYENTSKILNLRPVNWIKYLKL